MGSAKKILEEIRRGITPEILAQKIPWDRLVEQDLLELIKFTRDQPDLPESYNLLDYLFRISREKDLWFSVEVLSNAVQYQKMGLEDRSSILLSMRKRLDQIKDKIAADLPTEVNLRRYWLFEAAYYAVNGVTLNETGHPVEAVQNYQIARGIYEQLGLFQQADKYTETIHKLNSSNKAARSVRATGSLILPQMQPLPGDAPKKPASAALPAIKQTTPLVSSVEVPKNPVSPPPEVKQTTPFSGPVETPKSVTDSIAPHLKQTVPLSMPAVNKPAPPLAAPVETKKDEIAPDAAPKNQPESIIPSSPPKVVQVAAYQSVESQPLAFKHNTGSSSLEEKKNGNSAVTIVVEASPETRLIGESFAPQPDVWIGEDPKAKAETVSPPHQELIRLADQIQEQTEILTETHLQIQMFLSRRSILSREVQNLERKIEGLKQKLERLEKKEKLLDAQEPDQAGPESI